MEHLIKKNIHGRRLAVLGFTLFFCLNAYASWQSRWMENFLVGASMGIGDRKATFRTQLEYTNFPLLQSTVRDNEISDSGIITSGVIGYQQVRQQWVVGGEINLDLQNMDEEHHFAFSDSNQFLGWNGRVRYQSNIVIGTTGRIGFALTPYFMPYGRAGVEFSQEKLSVSYSTISMVLGQPYNVELLSSETHWIHRFLFGAGIEFPIPNTCGGTIRLEYDFHSKGRTISTHSSLIDQLIFPSLSSEMQPWTKTGRVSVIWNVF